MASLNSMVKGWLMVALSLAVLLVSFPCHATAGQLTWTSLTPLALPTAQPAAGVVDGKIMVLGGATASGATAAVAQYDPANDGWLAKSNLTEPRFAGGVAVNGATVFIAGGLGAVGADTTVLAYDTSDGTSSIIGYLTTGRTNAAAVVLENSLYVIGGSGGDFDSIEAFDLSIKTSQTKTLLPAPRQLAAAVELGGKIFIIGGLDKYGVATNTCWLYNPASNSFSGKSPMPVAASGKTAITFNGKIYIIGGMTASGTSPAWTTLIQEYDPATDRWRIVGSLLTSRYATVAAVVNGSLFVIGGDDGVQVTHPLAVNETTSLAQAGTVWSWGDDGNHPDVHVGDTLQVSGIDDVIAMGAGAGHALVVKSDGTVWSWGTNLSGELGRSGAPEIPGQVAGLSGMIAVAGGDGFSLALGADGTVQEWGYHDYAPNLTGINAIAAGGSTALALKTDGTVMSWDTHTAPTLVSGLTGVNGISRGMSYSLALKGNGTVWSWGGDNGRGQLGRSGDPAVPGAVTGLTGITAVAAGNDHAVAVKVDGTVWTWGNGAIAPVQVNGLTGIVAVAAGNDFTLALKVDGTVWAWGAAVGITTPGLVKELSGVTAVAAYGVGYGMALVPATASPRIVNAALAAGMVGRTYQQTLAAAGGSTTHTWAVTSGAIPDGLSLDPGTGIIAGTPTTVVTANFTVRVTDTNNASIAKDFSIIVYEPLAIPTAEMAPATTGLPYSQPLTATGGLAPYNWSLSSGSLAPGLSLDQATGTISGTPEASGPFDFTVQATDAINFSVEKGYRLSVYEPLAITTATLPSGNVRNSYNPNNDRMLTAIGGKLPYVWTVSSGRLPVGMSLDSATGQLMGTPAMTGTFAFIAKVTDANGTAVTKPLRIEIAMTPGALWSWGYQYLGRPGDPAVPGEVTALEGVQAIAFGGPSAAALKGDGTIWTWGNNQFGALGRSGDPNVPGPVPNMTGVSVAVGIDQTLVLKADGTVWIIGATIWSGPEPWLITGVDQVKAIAASFWYGLALKEDGTVWRFYQRNSAVQVNGLGNVVAIAQDDQNDNFLALKADGTVWRVSSNGTAAAIAGLDHVVAVGGGLALKDDGTAWTTDAPPAIISGLTNVIAVTNGLVATADGTARYLDGNQLPNLSGIAAVTANGSSYFAISPYTSPRIITPSLLPNATTGMVNNYPISVAGGQKPYNCSVTAGSLPPNMHLVAATCTVTGTPTATGLYNLTVQAQDTVLATDSRAFSVNVYDPLLITPETLPAGGVGTPYNGTITITGGKPPYYSNMNYLPAGLSYDYTTGAITGTPTSAGTSYVYVSASDDNSVSVTKNYNLVVLGIATSSLPAGQAGIPYSQRLATNDTEATLYNWSVSAGSLPPGLLLDGPTGLLMGTPTTAGTYPFTLQVSGRSTQTSKAFTITIAAAPPVTGYHWTGIGPYGGSIQVLTIDPTNTDTLYAGTYGGGVFKSVNGGNSWSPASSSLSNPNVRAIIVDPAAPATLYAGTTGGVFKSIDGGQNWGAINTGFSYYTNISALVLSPTAPTTLYAGTSGGLYKSMNGGGSWALASPSWSITSVTIDPTNPATLYLATSWEGVYRSYDGGGTWSAVNTGLPEDYDFGGIYVGPLVIDPATPTTIYTTSYGALYKSTNGGDTWNALPTGIANAYVSGIMFDPATPTVMYAGISGNIYRSVNGGGSWNVVNGSLANVGLLAIDPLNSAKLYAAAGYEGGVLKSADGGASWNTINSGLSNTGIQSLAIDPVSPATVYAGTANGVQKGTNGVWSAFSTGLPLHGAVNALALDTASTTLYAAASGTAYKSTSGSSWSVANSGLPSYYGVRTFAIDPATSPTTVYAGTGSGVYRSTNGGGSWSADNAGFPAYPYLDVIALTVAPTTPTTLYAALGAGDEMMGYYEAGVYKRTGSGAWSKINPAVSYFYANALAADPAGTTVYAGVNGSGVYKSTNGGAWTLVNTGLTDLGVSALALDPAIPTTLYAATAGGVFKSSNGGSNWAPFNTGLTNGNIVNLTIDPINGVLYAGAYRGGVYKVPTDLAIVTATLPTGSTGSPYSAVIKGVGGHPVYSWSIISGALPAGLSLDSATGAVAGTPTVAGNSSITVKVTDADSVTATKTFALTVLGITTATLPDGTTTLPYSQTLTAAGGTPSYTWAHVAGDLPGGLIFNPATATISGNPNQYGTYTITFRVTDSTGATATKAFPFRILAGRDLAATAVSGDIRGLSGTTASMNYTVLAHPDGEGMCYFPVKIYLSSDTVITSADRLIYTDGIGCVQPGVPYQKYAQVTIPADLAPGTYYWGVVLNDPYQFSETNTANNIMAGNQIAVGPDQSIIYTVDAAVIAGQGTVTPTSAPLYYGASQTITITPPPGGYIQNLTDNNVPVSAVAGPDGTFTYTLTNLASSHSLRVGFAMLPAPEQQFSMYSDGRAYQTMVLLTDGTALHSGGIGKWGSVLNTQEAFMNDYHHQMGNRAIMKKARAGHTATLLADGRVLLVGGDYPSYATAEILTASGYFSSLTGSLNTPRTGFTATLLPNGKVLIAGGQAYSSGTILSSTELYDPATGTFAYGPALLAPRTHAVATALSDGRVLLTGGYGATSTAEIFDPASGGFSSAGSMNSPRSAHLAIRLANNKVLLAGGNDGGSGTSAELFDPATGTFTPTGTMTTARQGATATLLPDGRVMFVGGSNLYTTESYDPISGSFTAEGTFPLARSYHSAALLSTGELLIVGGINNGVSLVEVVLLKLPAISAAPLVGAGIGAPYSQALAASNGATPYSWAVSAGNLPSGLVLDPATGVISGTPTSVGVFSFTLRATDANGFIATAVRAITVAPELVVGSPDVTQCRVGSTCTITVPISGGRPPYTCSLASGSLPAGLVLSSTASACAVTGTPTTAGSYSFTIQVADANLTSVARTIPLQVLAPLVITTSSLPFGTSGTFYNQTLMASGGLVPYSWSLADGTTLPAGLSLDPATGTISGVPSAPGVSNFTVKVTDTTGTETTQPLSIAVYPPLSVTPETLSEGTIDTPYSQPLTASGGRAPYTWAICSGALPPGLSLDPATGIISGTPTGSGVFSFTICVTDANGTTLSKSFAINIYGQLVVTTSSLPTATVGALYSKTLTASGGKTPYSSWSISAGNLPAGLSLNISTGTISGTPTTTGSFTITARVTDARGLTADKTLEIIVYPPLAITTTALAEGTKTYVYSQGLIETGGAGPFTWTVTSGDFPPGLTLASATGVISGTPSRPDIFTFTVRITDVNGAWVEKTLTIRINGLFSMPGGFPLDYPTIGDAYRAVLPGIGEGRLNLLARDFTENLLLNMDTVFTLAGGYDASYSSNQGYTTLIGTLTISDGEVTIENLIIQ